MDAPARTARGPTADSVSRGGATAADAEETVADQALHTLYMSNYQSLVRIAVSLVHDTPKAEEIVQDAFVAMHAAWPRLRDTDKALAYLRQAVVNRSRSVLRHLAVVAKYPPNPPTEAPSAEETALGLIQRSEIVTALRALTDRQREALVLRYYADLSEAQIASAMGISRGTVKTHTTRGLSALRTVLEHKLWRPRTHAAYQRATNCRGAFRRGLHSTLVGPEIASQCHRAVGPMSPNVEETRMRSPLPRRPGLAAVQVALTAVVVAGSGLAATAAPAAAATCVNVNVVVARGTFEPGTLGIIVGDPVYSALQTALAGKSTSSYPVNYPASLDVFSNPNSATQGNTDLVNHVTSEAAACPSERFILVGYSQGANVVDNSIGISSDGALVGGPISETIPNSIQPRIAAILLFGNPIRAEGKSVTGVYASRTDDFCASGDPVCQSGGINVLAHLSYTGDAGAAAAFAAARVG